MSYAINLSKKNLGITAPNPCVGCVIVKNGEIITTGVTQKNGRPHAEKNAIDKINDKEILKNAEIYVTLEPCSHFGKTLPCVDEIIKFGFKRVVVAVQDPDQRVNGGGIKKLKEAGIETIIGVLENEAKEVNRGFFKAKKTSLPFVTLKIATSLDGKIATKNFDSKWITSDKARNFAHYLRSINDAIVVGANTVRKDDPFLNCRIEGLEDFSPKIFVISNKKDFSPKFNIFQNQQNQPAIIGGNLKEILQNICNSGLNNVLVEGGSNLATQFLKEELVDELVWIRSQKIIGNDGIPAIGEMQFSSINEVLSNFTRTDIQEFSSDIVEFYSKF
ncbi:MAG: bifunctional diaminohydroxyphosphoribosylaminopyrimidine deaminase/5-amino-6-(5-phosphoribosylamino)uracil reductase RibD [Pelagibacterales bacterium]|nr:bifunctional diaminohydroxyphosphoribosylaminopyrimidine deaminase/5-amino-6-(5-phosphoribosylamino)uracil reductase RibD [Pelagibacterales bacterium]